MSLYLNPRIKTEDVLRLQKQQTEFAEGFLSKYHAELAKMDDPKMRDLYARMMAPVIAMTFRPL